MRLPLENKMVPQDLVPDRDSMGILLSFLNNADLISFMMTSKRNRELVHMTLYIRDYVNLIRAWNKLLQSEIIPPQMEQLKSLAATMYERGLIRKIISDLNKVNLKAVIISALLNDCEFRPENHTYLELASHLLFFNKSSDILYAQGGDNYDKFPLSHELESLVERYAQQTQRDSFYLIFTSSPQVIYYNKLTRSAEVFLCPHAGLGVFGCPNDHIFSILLMRRIGHVDCLVDVPATDLAPGINLRDTDSLNAAIRDSSLFLSFYRSYKQSHVDSDPEYQSFTNVSGYKDHYSKTNPAALNGNPRDGRLEQYIDYLMEQHFPIVDNGIYNAQAEDRRPIVLKESQCLEDLAQGRSIAPNRAAYYSGLGRGLTMFSHAPSADAGNRVLQAMGFQARPFDPSCSDNLGCQLFNVSKTIAHKYYSDVYISLNTKEDLMTFLISADEKLNYIDYGQTILERLDYGYLCTLFLKEGLESSDDVREWLRKEYGAHENFAALEQRVQEIRERGMAQIHSHSVLSVAAASASAAVSIEPPVKKSTKSCVIS